MDHITTCVQICIMIFLDLMSVQQFPWTYPRSQKRIAKSRQIFSYVHNRECRVFSFNRSHHMLSTEVVGMVAADHILDVIGNYFTLCCCFCNKSARRSCNKRLDIASLDFIKLNLINVLTAELTPLYARV